MRTRRLITLGLVATLPAMACTPSTTPPPPAASATPSVAAAPAHHPALLNPARATATAPAAFKVRFDTTRGTFTVGVTRAWAPRGADRFYNLVQARFYDDTGFFRVVPGFVVQFGLSGDPRVSSAWETARIVDDPVRQSNRRGRVTFATAGPNTRTTQIFISTADNPNLDMMGFAPFGEVLDGLDTVSGMYAGYGESPDQGLITANGNAYLKVEFPRLDFIRAAKIVE